MLMGKKRIAHRNNKREFFDSTAHRIGLIFSPGQE